MGNEKINLNFLDSEGLMDGYGRRAGIASALVFSFRLLIPE